ncbi:MAG: LysE family translocator [Boseongicola sp. SB0675_bin_26]|nr:LysE family translocator [Boseongicola sp. SB0675_bin_26]
MVAFIPAALALNLTPGADMLFCLAQGARAGMRAGIAASAGVSAGAMVHVTLAGLGLGYLVTQHPILFDVIRYAGVAYLLWLAQKSLRTPLGARDMPDIRHARAFRDGLVVNLTNPKVALFILAFVPQFVDPDRAVLPQFLILGAVIAVGGFVINGAVGAFSGRIANLMARTPTVEQALRILSASIFATLALRLVLEGRRA